LARGNLCKAHTWSAAALAAHAPAPAGTIYGEPAMHRAAASKAAFRRLRALISKLGEMGEHQIAHGLGCGQC